MKQQTTPPIPVLFRKWPNGHIEAWFPTLPGTYFPSSCQTYAHCHQHATGYIPVMAERTKSATETEYAPLLRELTEQVGYTLRVVKRVTYQMTQERINALRKVSK